MSKLEVAREDFHYMRSAHHFTDEEVEQAARDFVAAELKDVDWFGSVRTRTSWEAGYIAAVGHVLKRLRAGGLAQQQKGAGDG